MDWPLRLTSSCIYYPLLIALVALHSNARAKEWQNVEHFVDINWHSQYITEGRDNLSGNDLHAFQYALSTDDINASIWLANATDSDYQELNVNIDYSFRFAGTDMYVGYSRIEQLDGPGANQGDDDEVLFGLGYQLRQIHLALDYVHSRQFDGGFLTALMTFPLSYHNQTLWVEPYLSQNFDFGYASESYDGPSHLEAGIRVSWQYTESIDVHGTVARALAQADVKNDGGGDVTWGIMGIAWRF